MWITLKKKGCTYLKKLLSVWLVHVEGQDVLVLASHHRLCRVVGHLGGEHKDLTLLLHKLGLSTGGWGLVGHWPHVAGWRGPLRRDGGWGGDGGLGRFGGLRRLVWGNCFCRRGSTVIGIFTEYFCQGLSCKRHWNSWYEQNQTVSWINFLVILSKNPLNSHFYWFVFIVILVVHLTPYQIIYKYSTNNKYHRGLHVNCATLPDRHTVS